MTAIVRFTHPLCRQHLNLEHTPGLLRFACKSITSVGREWDALDAPGDVAEDGEYLVAGQVAIRTRVHVHGTVSEWRSVVTYEPVEPQPSQEIMRDRLAWLRWCGERVAK